MVSVIEACFHAHHAVRRDDIMGGVASSSPCVTEQDEDKGKGPHMVVFCKSLEHFARLEQSVAFLLKRHGALHGVADTRCRPVRKARL